MQLVSSWLSSLTEELLHNSSISEKPVLLETPSDAGLCFIDACLQLHTSPDMSTNKYAQEGGGKITKPLMCTEVKWKSAQRRRKHCMLAVVRRSQKFSLCHRPLPGVWDGQNLINWRWSLPLSTNPVCWGSMHEFSSYRGNRPTNTQTHTHTHRQDQLQYTAMQLC